MALFRSDLLARWCDLVSPKDQVTDAVDLASYGVSLLDRWSEPWRRYHTVDHLAAVLIRADQLSDHADDLDAVLLAAWFHDAVYELGRGENEERSALLAERELPRLGVGRVRVVEVARLVRLTADHHPVSGDRNGEALCDADLAVLGGSPDEYGAYASAVRDEYRSVPDEAFRKGRADVLRQLLALPGLFRTPTGRRRWEERARRNLHDEQARLSDR